LKEIGDIEQTLATGLESSGDSFSSNKMLSKVVQVN
jgi:hypothetical protein